MALQSGDDGGSIKLWDTQTGELIRVLRGHRARVNDVEFSPDGSRLASASGDHTVKLWDPKTGDEILTLLGHSDTVRCLNWSANGRRLVSADFAGNIAVWDAEGGYRTATQRVIPWWTVGPFEGTFRRKITDPDSVSPDLPIADRRGVKREWQRVFAGFDSYVDLEGSYGRKRNTSALLMDPRLFPVEAEGDRALQS